MFNSGVQTNPNRTDPGEDSRHAISEPGYQPAKLTLADLRERFGYEPRRRPHVGKKPMRTWSYGGLVVQAVTRSEARAAVKRLLHLHRLPAGAGAELVEIGRAA